MTVMNSPWFGISGIANVTSEIAAKDPNRLVTCRNSTNAGMPASLFEEFKRSSRDMGRVPFPIDSSKDPRPRR